MGRSPLSFVPEGSRAAFSRDAAATAARAVLFTLYFSIAAQLVQELGGGALHVAVLRTAPAAGLLLSLLSVRVGRGRSPLVMIAWPESASRLLLCLVGAFGALEGTPALAAAFAIVVSAAHATAALAVPHLSAVYGLVYPARDRARLVAVIRFLNGAVAILAGWTLGKLFSMDPQLHRVVYPAAGLLGLALTWHFCTMPVPAARESTRREGPSAWAVLRGDRNFALFQLFQFVLGFANLAVIPLVDLHVRRDLGLSIDLAVLVVNQGVVAQAATLLTVQWQGRLLDRLGVVRHRVATSVLLGLGLLTWSVADGLPGAALAATFTGLGMAGGQIIWIIGSLYFAPRDQLSTYSGIHTFLTGARGLLAPACGTLLVARAGFDVRGVFVMAAALVFASALGHALFVRLPERADDDSAHAPPS